MDKHKYAVYIEWPYDEWRRPLVRYIDKDWQPLTDVAQAIKEGKRWRVSGEEPTSTEVTIFEAILKM